MKNADFLAEGASVVLTASQTNNVFQTISLILTIIATLFSIISRIVIWYRKAKADGKITKDELKRLANLEEKDIDRIIKMHLSPINVSVHTTNPELRVK